MKCPSEKTVKKLFALSRNRCAYPDCLTVIVQPTGTVTGEICHIKAQNQDGPRFDPKQSNEERHGFDNLILLCNVHHCIIDSEPERYTVELLGEMKELHERDGNIELTQQDARLVQRLLDSHIQVKASGSAQVMVNSPGGVQAQTLTIKTTKRSVKVQPPAEVTCPH